MYIETERLIITELLLRSKPNNIGDGRKKKNL